MGTLRHWGFEGIAEGANLTTTNLLADSGTAPTALSVTGTRTATATNAHDGMAGKIAATGSALIRLPFAVAHTKAAVSFYMHHSSVPASWVPFGFRTSADASIGTFTITTASVMQGGGGTGSANIVAQLNRYEVLIDTAAGTYSVRVFAGDSTTPYCTLSGTGNSWGSATIAAIDFGSVNAATATGTFDDFQLEENRTTEIGRWLATLTTPVVTLTGQTAASSGSAMDGTATVTWPAVPNAASYTAHIADSTSPGQGDFTQVAAGVTSPYTFTGLGIGAKALGIKAKS